MTELPAFEAALVRAAHRRYGWRRWRPRAAGAVIVAAVAGVALLVARPPAPDDERPAVRWTTTSVPRYGLAVSLPAGWVLAPRTLTALVDPREIMTATTFAAVPTAPGCGPFPAVRLRPGGALVTVQERAGAVGFAPRPQRFSVAATSPIVVQAVRQCVGGAGLVSWQDFSDGLRNFHALVVVDRSASTTVRSEAFGTSTGSGSTAASWLGGPRAPVDGLRRVWTHVRCSPRIPARRWSPCADSVPAWPPPRRCWRLP